MSSLAAIPTSSQAHMKTDAANAKSAPSKKALSALKKRAENLSDANHGQCVFLSDITALAPELLAAGWLDKPIFSANTALSMACSHGDSSSVAFLLGIGADAKAPTLYGQSALMEAVKSLAPNDPSEAVEFARVLECMELVVAAGCDIHHKNQVGQQAINWAAWSSKRLPAARWLLDRGANPSAACDSGNTPLHDAAQSGQLETVELFLAAGADIEAKTTADGRSLDVLGVAVEWLPFHHNYKLVGALAQAQLLLEGSRAAERESKALRKAAPARRSTSKAKRQRL